MDLRRLRESTRPEHEATETRMPLMGADLSRALYLRVLQALLPIVSGWERWAAEYGPADLQPLLAARRRGHLLEADLAALGVEPSEAAEPRVDWDTVAAGETGGAAHSLHSPEFTAGFLGSLYVMEGSTLGGRYIARHVEATLGLTPGLGNAYFQGHGEQTGAMWREVTARIAAVPEPHAERVIDAARRTFRAFGDALDAAIGGKAVGG